jgi:hypothetical protein
MTVFELLGTSAWSRNDLSIGLFSTQTKAEEKIKAIKSGKEWKMSWSSLRVVEVNVE